MKCPRCGYEFNTKEDESISFGFWTRVNYGENQYAICEICGKHVKEVYVKSDDQIYVKNYQPLYWSRPLRFMCLECMTKYNWNDLTDDDKRKMIGMRTEYIESA